jgi:glucose dehydrogenase
MLSAVLSGTLAAQTLDDLKRDGNGGSTDNVLTHGMGYHQQRYSPLKQINKSTVKRLVPVWSASLDNNLGEQVQPMVYNGKVFRGTLDAHVVALDQKTGKEVWKQKAAEWTEGYSMTNAPQIANGVLITGISGGEFGVRGFIDGWDPDTGKKPWRTYTTAAPGEPGGDTWPATGDHHLRGGAGTWMTGSYDPELDLVYWGTGNAGPWAPHVRPGDNLYVASVIAVRPKTGQIAWHFQWTPGDMYDHDAINEKYWFEPKVEFKQGTRYLGHGFKFIDGGHGVPLGHFEAIDPLTGKAKWRVPLNDFTQWAGTISTAGGVLITGKRTGELIIVDENDGKTLWQFKTSSAIHSMPITYTHKGRQYLTVLNGPGGNTGISNPAIRQHVSPGASVWTFALMQE